MKKISVIATILLFSVATVKAQSTHPYVIIPQQTYSITPIKIVTGDTLKYAVVTYVSDLTDSSEVVTVTLTQSVDQRHQNINQAPQKLQFVFKKYNRPFNNYPATLPDIITMINTKLGVTILNH